MEYIVYKITNESNQKSYIGFSSKSLENRWKKHLFDASLGRKTYLCNAIRKYGADCFTKTVVFQTHDLEEAKQAETKCIALHKTHFIIGNGYNMTHGGDGTLGHKHSDDTKIKLSIASTGRKHSESTKKKLSEQRKGSGNPNFQRTFSDEHKRKISAVTSGASNPRSKTFRVTNPKGEVFMVDDRAGFCKDNNLNYSSVASSIRRGTSHKGFKFEEITKPF